MKPIASSGFIKILGPSILRTAAIPLLCVGYLTVMKWQSQRDEEALTVFPQFRLPKVTSTSEFISNEQLKGQAFLAIFWASWCEPCKKQRKILDPWILEKKPTYGLLGIATLDQKSAVEALEAQSPHPFPSVLDDDGQLAKSLGLTAIPYAVLVDSKGKILRKYTGPLSIKELEGMQALVKN